MKCTQLQEQCVYGGGGQTPLFYASEMHLAMFLLGICTPSTYRLFLGYSGPVFAGHEPFLQLEIGSTKCPTAAVL